MAEKLHLAKYILRQYLETYCVWFEVSVIMTNPLI